MLLKSLTLPFLALQLAAVTCANPILEERKLTCSSPKVKSLIKTAKSAAPTKSVNSFCSSYLKYKTKTKTITSTYTFHDVHDHSVTAGTFTVLAESTVFPSRTVTVTRTIPVFEGVKKRGDIPEPTQSPDQVPGDAGGELEARAGPQKLKVDSRGCVFGFQPSIVSEACSCLVTKPPTVTITTATFIPISVDVTVTVPAATATSWTTYTEFQDSTTSSVTTVVSSKPTDCGTEAQPTFFVQLRDVDLATRSDKYNNDYVGIMYSSDFRGFDEAAPVPFSEKDHAALVYMEPGTGYLRSVNGGLYLNVDYFSSLTNMYWDTKAFVDLHGYHYVACSIDKSGPERELLCHVADSAWDQKYVLTCPLYEDYYGNPVVAADYTRTPDDAPDCYQKRLFVVDACS